MREFLGIDKALQSIQGELLNNTSKLAEIDKSIKRDTKKLEEVEMIPLIPMNTKGYTEID